MHAPPRARAPATARRAVVHGARALPCMVHALLRSEVQGVPAELAEGLVGKVGGAAERRSGLRGGLWLGGF